MEITEAGPTHRESEAQAESHGEGCGQRGTQDEAGGGGRRQPQRALPRPLGLGAPHQVLAEAQRRAPILTTERCLV